jgi:hypothetical protein
MRTAPYLNRLKQHSKGLYRLTRIYIAGSLLAALMGIKYLPFLAWGWAWQAYPFYAWGMFSGNTVLKKNPVFYVLRYDGKVFNLPVWQDHTRYFFEYTIKHYDRLAAHQYQDPAPGIYTTKLGLPAYYARRAGNTPEAVQQYPQWLKHYLSQNRNTNIQELEVCKYWGHFDAQAHLITDSSKIIIHE